MKKNESNPPNRGCQGCPVHDVLRSLIDLNKSILKREYDDYKPMNFPKDMDHLFAFSENNQLN